MSDAVESEVTQLSWSQDSLADEQKKDPFLKELRCLTDEGVREDASKPSVSLRDGILMRRCRSLTSKAENFSVLDQIVVPACYTDKIIEQDHAGLLGGSENFG